jgi:hypothetical protein
MAKYEFTAKGKTEFAEPESWAKNKNTVTLVNRLFKGAVVLAMFFEPETAGLFCLGLFLIGAASPQNLNLNLYQRRGKMIRRAAADILRRFGARISDRWNNRIRDTLG